MENIKLYTLFLLLLFCVKFGDITAQRIPADSLYQKNSFGIEFGTGFGIFINHPTYEGFNRMTLTPRLGINYFFAKRWSVSTTVTRTIFRSNRPDLRPAENYLHRDLTTRYHFRKWYCGVGGSYGNSAISIIYNDLIAYAPRQKLVAYGNIGLHRLISQHKKFWKNTFFVFDLKVGMSLYTEFKSDGLSRDLTAWDSHIGLNYIIKPKAKKPKTE